MSNLLEAHQLQTTHKIPQVECFSSAFFVLEVFAQSLFVLPNFCWVPSQVYMRSLKYKSQRGRKKQKTEKSNGETEEENKKTEESKSRKIYWSLFDFEFLPDAFPA